MSSDSLGDRMKEQYEDRARYMLPRRTYTILRLDGRGFHSLLKKAARPFDRDVMDAMNFAAQHVCAGIAGARFGYVQSDEISVLLTDFTYHGTQPWFNGNVSKLTSVSACIAANNFNASYLNRSRFAEFDCRAFTIPDQVEVANYFIWRQRDAIRNAILATAQARFGHRAIQNKNVGELRVMLDAVDFDWRTLSRGFLNGRIIRHDNYRFEAPSGPAFRRRWVNRVAPDFSCVPGEFLSQWIPPMPSLDPGTRLQVQMTQGELEAEVAGT